MDMPNIPMPGAPMSLGTTGGVSESLRELARRLEQDKTQADSAVVLMSIAGQLMMVWTGPTGGDTKRSEVEIMRMIALSGEALISRSPDLLAQVMAENAATVMLRAARGGDEAAG